MNAEREPIAPNRVFLSDILERREFELDFDSRGSRVEFSLSFQIVRI